MRILIAEDDAISLRVLESALTKWGHEVIPVTTGSAAFEGLKALDPPQLATLDWMMSEMDGVEVCSRIRPATADRMLYIILLTARGRKEDIVTGLEAGADDYLVKPFDREELRARLNAGIRIIDLQTQLT